MTANDNVSHDAITIEAASMTSRCDFSVRHALLLLVGYVALDWASYYQPLHDLNITPWNPAAALAVVFLLRYGWRAAMPIPFAIVIGDAWVRAIPASFLTSAILAALLTAGYLGTSKALLHAFNERRLFLDRSGLIVWVLIIVVATCLISLAFGVALVQLNMIPASSFPSAFVGHWIGDCIGIIVSMPLLWMLANASGRVSLWKLLGQPEAAAIVIGTVLAFYIAFGIGGAADYKYFYVLFLPAIWSAARFGFAGAAAMAALLQIGIAITVSYLDFKLVSAFEIQILMLVLAGVGFVLGIVVEEQRRASADLRQSLRLAAAGEMAGALAHELNQPLTAISAYSETCEQMLDLGRSGNELRGPIRGIVRESVRAADTVRRLRDFFRSGTTNLEQVNIQSLIENAATPFVSRAQRDAVKFSFDGAVSGTVLADRVQLEVVLRNLLANAFDAVAARPQDGREVVLRARRKDSGALQIDVRDTGPGLPVEFLEQPYEPFRSTKASGLGLGLAISRAIVEAHGGELRAISGGAGLFEVVLPIEKDGV